MNNAADALEENTHEREREISIEIFSDPQGVRVHLEDSAGGMPEHLLDKATEAYFTTKPADKGTGLGLSISREILRDMNGELTLSNGDKGLRASIGLPHEVTAPIAESQPEALAQQA